MDANDTSRLTPTPPIVSAHEWTTAREELLGRGAQGGNHGPRGEPDHLRREPGRVT